jgi:hypothetical protein
MLPPLSFAAFQKQQGPGPRQGTAPLSFAQFQRDEEEKRKAESGMLPAITATAQPSSGPIERGIARAQLGMGKTTPGMYAFGEEREQLTPQQRGSLERARAGRAMAEQAGAFAQNIPLGLAGSALSTAQFAAQANPLLGGFAPKVPALERLEEQRQRQVAPGAAGAAGEMVGYMGGEMLQAGGITKAATKAVMPGSRVAAALESMSPVQRALGTAAVNAPFDVLQGAKSEEGMVLPGRIGGIAENVLLSGGAGALGAALEAGAAARTQVPRRPMEPRAARPEPVAPEPIAPEPPRSIIEEPPAPPRPPIEEPSIAPPKPPEPAVAPPVERPPVASVPAQPGRPTVMTLSDGSKLQAQYKVVDAESLISSHSPSTFQADPRYPAGVQGRDYAADKATQAVVRSRAMEFDPDLALDASISADKGPPLITADGVVVAGNERSMLVRLAQEVQPQRYDAYRQSLEARAAEFGLTPEQVRGMARPVLVREIVDPSVPAGDTRRLAEINRLSDTPDTKVKRSQDDATSRAAALRQADDALEHFSNTMGADETLADYLTRAEGRDFVRRLVDDGVIARQEMARYMDPRVGTLTEEGRSMVRRMMMAAAVDRPDVAPPSVLLKLEKAVPSLVVMRRNPEWDLSGAVQGALDVLGDAQARGMKLDDLLSQGAMFGEAVPPDIAAMAQFLQGANKATITDRMRQYAVQASEALERAQSIDVFGGLAASPLDAKAALMGVDPATLRGGDELPTMMRAPRGRAKDVAQADMFGARQPELDQLNRPISAEEMARRRRELGASDTYTSDDPIQGALLSPAPAIARDTPIADVPLRSAALAEAADTPAQILTKREIAVNLAKALDAPLREGRFYAGQRRALGIYTFKTQVSRVLRKDRLSTVAHEIGHYVSNEYLKNPAFRGAARRGAPVIPPAVAGELDAAGKALYGTRKPAGGAGGYKEEGIAEYFKAFVSDPDDIARRFPSTDAWMRSALAERDPKILAAFEQAQTDFRRYQTSSASKRVGSMISRTAETQWAPSMDDLLRQYNDDLIDVRRAVEQLESLGGKKASYADAYTLARLARGSAGYAKAMIDRGVIAGVGPSAEVLTSRSLRDVLRRVPKKDLPAFEEYLLAERALEKGGFGAGADSEGRLGISRADAERIVAQDGPRFRALAQGVWEQSNGLVRLMERSGLVTAEQAEQIIAKNQRRVPAYRDFSGDTEALAGGAGGGGKRMPRSTSGIRTMSQAGSSRRILPPTESLVADFYETAALVRQQEALNELVRMASSTTGGGRIAEIVPGTSKKSKVLITKQQLDQLHDMGIVSDDMYEELAENIVDFGSIGSLEQWLESRKVGAKEQRNLIVPWLNNGKVQLVQIGDVNLYKTLMGMNKAESGMMAKILEAPAAITRIGAILSPTFQVLNPLRDMMAAFVRTQAGRWVAPGEHLARGLFHVVNRTDLYDQWRVVGGQNADFVSGLDRKAKRATAAQLRQSSKERAVRTIAHPLEALKAISQFSEELTRLGEYELVFKRYLKEGKSADEAAALAGLASRDVSVDHAKAGTILREINKIYAFANAKWQGNFNMANDFITRPKEVIPKAVASIALPTMALYALQREDPVYQEADQYLRDNNWVVVWPPLPMRRALGISDRDATLIRFPKPFEWGTLFGTVPERLAQFIETKDPDALDQMAKQLWENFLPGSPETYLEAPTAARPIVELATNRDLFRRRPIVPPGVEGEEPWRQSAPGTGETARVVGEAVNVSPAKLEHLITGYTAGLGRQALRGTDAAVRAAREAMGKGPMRYAPPEQKGLYGAPVISTFFRPAPGANAASITRVYDEFKRAEVKRQTWRGLLAEGDTARSMTYLRQNIGDIANVATAADMELLFGSKQPGPLRAATDRLRQIREARTAMRTSVPQGSDEARKYTRQIDSLMIDASRQGVRDARALRNALQQASARP